MSYTSKEELRSFVNGLRALSRFLEMLADLEKQGFSINEFIELANQLSDPQYSRSLFFEIIKLLNKEEFIQFTEKAYEVANLMGKNIFTLPVDEKLKYSKIFSEIAELLARKIEGEE